MHRFCLRDIIAKTNLQHIEFSVFKSGIYNLSEFSKGLRPKCRICLCRSASEYNLKFPAQFFTCSIYNFYFWNLQYPRAEFMVFTCRTSCNVFIIEEFCKYMRKMGHARMNEIARWHRNLLYSRGKYWFHKRWKMLSSNLRPNAWMLVLNKTWETKHSAYWVNIKECKIRKNGNVKM
jgi:hypothetical protein